MSISSRSRFHPKEFTPEGPSGDCRITDEAAVLLLLGEHHSRIHENDCLLPLTLLEGKLAFPAGLRHHAAVLSLPTNAESLKVVRGSH